jgi:hypothetical protein
MTQSDSQVIELSFFEWRAQVAKAARGAGLPWGHAEEAGWAADWLVHRGLPAADWVATWLRGGVGGPTCPVAFGVGLSDCCAGDPASGLPTVPADLPAPGLLLPFMWRCASGGGTIALRGPEGLAARVDAMGEVTFGPGWAGVARGWSLWRDDAPPAAPGRLTPRPVVTVALMKILAGLALRTMVPASEISRADAGAAVSDND